MIDSHIHLFERGYRGKRPCGQELLEYAEHRDRFGITASLVVGYEGDELHRGNNDYLARVAREHPWVHPVAYVPAERGGSAVTLADPAAAPFVGISLYVLNESSMVGLMSWTAAEWARVPEPGIVSVNTIPSLMPRIGLIAAEHPRLTFMVSHFGSPPELDEGGVPGALRHLIGLAPIENVHVKASGYYALADRGWSVMEQAAATIMTIEAFGVDRVHWGSDFSPCLEATTFDAAVSPPGFETLTAGQQRRVEHEALSTILGRLRHR